MHHPCDDGTDDNAGQGIHERAPGLRPQRPYSTHANPRRLAPLRLVSSDMERVFQKPLESVSRRRTVVSAGPEYRKWRDG
jgi:hypothetical protein